MSSATIEIRNLTPDALRVKVEELQKDIRKHSFHGFRRQEKNVNHLRNLRHELARVLTISTEREKTDSSPGSPTIEHNHWGGSSQAQP